MAKHSREAKLELAKQHFYSYRFFQAYQIYQQLFSTLAFQNDPVLLEHVGIYLRILIEMGRTKEVEFYLPILEGHFESSRSPLAAYALGYFYYIAGNMKRALSLLNWSRDHAGTNHDLRVKTIMLLAHLSPSPDESTILLGTIQEPPQDEKLAQFLEIWRAIILRYQGSFDQSITRLQTLIAKFDEERDWYSVIAAEEALVKTFVDKLDYTSARNQLIRFQNRCELQKFRTVKNHLAALNRYYFDSLRSRTIEVQKANQKLTMIYRGNTTEIRQPELIRLITLFQRNRCLTKRKVSSSLNVEIEQIEDISSRFIEKIERLNLPADSLNSESQKLHLIPTLLDPSQKENVW